MPILSKLKLMKIEDMTILFSFFMNAIFCIILLLYSEKWLGLLDNNIKSKYYRYVRNIKKFETTKAMGNL